MSLAAFQNLKYQNYTYPLGTSFTIANRGYAWDAVGDSIEVGMRKSGIVNRKGTYVTDHRQKKILDSVNLEADIDALQTSLGNLFNYMKLSKNPIQFRSSTYGEYYVHMTENTGSFGTPNGSALAGLGFEFNIDDKDRSIKLKLMAKLHAKEWAWILANWNAPVADATGGTVSLALSANAYDRNQYQYSGIEVIKIGPAGGTLVDIGDFNTPKFNMKSTSKAKDKRDRDKNRFCMVHGEFMMTQTAAADLLAVKDAELNDMEIEMHTWNDEVISIISACSVTHDVEFGDGKTGVKVSLDGEVPYNLIDGSPNTFDFSTPGSLIITMA